MSSTSLVNNKLASGVTCVTVADGTTATLWWRLSGRSPWSTPRRGRGRRFAALQQVAKILSALRCLSMISFVDRYSNAVLGGFWRANKSGRWWRFVGPSDCALIGLWMHSNIFPQYEFCWELVKWACIGCGYWMQPWRRSRGYSRWYWSYGV